MSPYSLVKIQCTSAYLQDTHFIEIQNQCSHAQNIHGSYYFARNSEAAVLTERCDAPLADCGGTS